MDMKTKETIYRALKRLSFCKLFFLYFQIFSLNLSYLNEEKNLSWPYLEEQH